MQELRKARLLAAAAADRLESQVAVERQAARRSRLAAENEAREVRRKWAFGKVYTIFSDDPELDKKRVRNDLAREKLRAKRIKNDAAARKHSLGRQIFHHLTLGFLF